ncbi:hypothetical protein C4D60_Mb01t14900 [Musa balbisiana]|uniref:THUMP domain-containing protein n=1 Tax=Musa balbisiana TaxID=52838 RepID=A0A4S8JPC5_MUSBA|nr:hypothetical protein C4D60_Mb01t14900 [Musa balbisiana]
MAGENKPKSNSNENNYSKGKKRKYLPYGKPVKKGLYPLRPGVQGVFLTCDGGRERQATNEALNLLETYYEEIVHGKKSDVKSGALPSKPLNKIIKFRDSDSSSDEDEDSHADESDASLRDHGDLQTKKVKEDASPSHEKEPEMQKSAEESEDLPSKKQRVNTCAAKMDNVECTKTDDKPIDELIEDELRELGDRNKRHFVSLDSGCNGVVFIQMHKRAGDPSPTEIVQHMMTNAASTKKHMSRFILRVIPVELTCYASEQEISKAIKPIIEQHFPNEAPIPQKFAVLYEARSNTGIERMTIIDAVAKSVPQPHKVDLKNPDKTIIVQIVKTICLIGVVERYKELSKYNLRELTSPKQ